jgi:hypothetical protein
MAGAGEGGSFPLFPSHSVVPHFRWGFVSEGLVRPVVVVELKVAAEAFFEHRKKDDSRSPCETAARPGAPTGLSRPGRNALIGTATIAAVVAVGLWLTNLVEDRSAPTQPTAGAIPSETTEKWGLNFASVKGCRGSLAGLIWI